MLRYIDAVKLEKEIQQEASESIANAVIRIIDRQPTVDIENSKTVKINLNEYVKFKLTQRGKDIYYHSNDELNAHLIERGIKTLIPSLPPAVDEEGYSSMQLWEFMNLYGKYLFIGADMILDPIEIVYERKGENDVKRDVEKL